MSEHPNTLHEVFASLNPHDVEQFYASYQRWTRQRQIAHLQTEIATLHQQIAENTEHLQQFYFSPTTLETITQLQSYGVTDSELLDRIIEHGDAWLERMMQHLAYCQQQNVLNESYTQWCERALDGAYDWIDSIDKALAPSATQVENDLSPQSIDKTQPADQPTEEVLLRKLMSDEADQEALLNPVEIGEPLPSETAQAEETPPQEMDVLPNEESAPEITDGELSDPDEFTFPSEQALAPTTETTAEKEQTNSEELDEEGTLSEIPQVANTFAAKHELVSEPPCQEVPTIEEAEPAELSEAASLQEEEQEPALQVPPAVHVSEQPDISQVETARIEVPSAEIATKQNQYTEAPSYEQPVPFSQIQLSSPASTNVTGRDVEAVALTQLQNSGMGDSEQPYQARKKRRSLFQRILDLFLRK